MKHLGLYIDNKDISTKEKVIGSSDNSVSNVIALTKAEYDVLTPAEKAGNTYITTDEPEASLATATQTTSGLMSASDYVKVNTPSFAQLQKGSAGQQSMTITPTKFIKFTDYISQGADFTGSVASQSITCNFTGYVQVSAKLYFYQANANDAIYMAVYNGTNIVTFDIQTAINALDHYTHIPAIILPVSNGNVLTIYVYNITASRGSAGGSASAISADYFLVRRI